MSRALIPAFLLLLGGFVLGATVFPEQVAHAAQSISATIAGPLDANGNVAVHEQGTANVNVTNSLQVAPAPPIASGGGRLTLATGETVDLFQPAVATALSIHMTNEASSIEFAFQARPDLANFAGPQSFGNSSIDLALTRPITFDRVLCHGSPAGHCSVSWVGAAS